MAVRGLIDRAGAAAFFTYPARAQSPRRRPRRLLVAGGPVDRRGHDRRRGTGTLPLPGQRRPPSLPPDRLPRRRGRRPDRRHAEDDHAGLRPPQRRGHQPDPPVHRGLRRRPRGHLPAPVRGRRRRRRGPGAPAPLLAEQSVGPLQHDAARRPRLLLLRGGVRPDVVHAAPAPRPQARLRAHRGDRHEPVAATAQQSRRRDPAPQRRCILLRLRRRRRASHRLGPSEP